MGAETMILPGTQLALPIPGAGHRIPGSPDVVVLGELDAASRLVATARFLGARIATGELAADEALVAVATPAGLTFAFRFGAVVTFARAGQAFASLDAALMPHVAEAEAVPEIETALLAIQPGKDDRLGTDGRIALIDASSERLLLVATVLARSVVLARDEVLVSEAFDRSAPLVADLRENGRARLSIGSVMRLVGEVLAARHRVMGTVQVGERPDVLWDHPELDRLYARLEAEYELKERDEALERKFAALGDFSEALLNIVQDKRAFRLEAAIIVLIALEVLLNLFDRFFG